MRHNKSSQLNGVTRLVQRPLSSTLSAIWSLFARTQVSEAYLKNKTLTSLRVSVEAVCKADTHLFCCGGESERSTAAALSLSALWAAWVRACSGETTAGDVGLVNRSCESVLFTKPVEPIRKSSYMEQRGIFGCVVGSGTYTAQMRIFHCLSFIKSLYKQHILTRPLWIRLFSSL